MEWALPVEFKKRALTDSKFLLGMNFKKMVGYCEGIKVGVDAEKVMDDDLNQRSEAMGDGNTTSSSSKKQKRDQNGGGGKICPHCHQPHATSNNFEDCMVLKANREYQKVVNESKQELWRKDQERSRLRSRSRDRRDRGNQRDEKRVSFARRERNFSMLEDRRRKKKQKRSRRSYDSDDDKHPNWHGLFLHILTYVGLLLSP